MIIALDATYSIDPEPSGIAVYSRELLNGLEASYPEDAYIRCYRWKQWKQARKSGGRLLQPPLPTFRAALFHSLNQRVDGRPAKRIVSTFHDLFVMTADYSSPEYRRRFTAQARRATERSDLIIAVSQFTADQVHGLLGVERTRIRVVAHGVRRSGRPDGPRSSTVLFVGALQRRKNIARLVDAFASLPPDWKLVLAGSPRGYGAPEILEHIAQCPYRDRIAITGYVPAERLEQLYAEASIFAFPSLDEGFGMPILEAMSRGLPVLASNTSAVVETAKTAALLVDPTDTNAISSGLLRLAEDPNERTRLSELGLAHAARYSWDRCVQETHAVYQELS